MTVGVTFTVRTIRRRPFGKVMSVVAGCAGGNLSVRSRELAHDGSSTGLVGVAVSCSSPPNPFDATASPEGAGLSSAVIDAWSTR